MLKLNFSLNKMDSDDESYINEAIISGDKPKISIEKKINY